MSDDEIINLEPDNSGNWGIKDSRTNGNGGSGNKSNPNGLVDPLRQLKYTHKSEEFELQDAFLQAYRKYQLIRYACIEARIPTSKFYYWKRKDQRFLQLFEEADAEVVDLLEDEAKRRAVVGQLTPVFYEGKIVGWKNERSDALLMFLLKGKKPEVYRERASVQVGGESTVLIMPSNGREFNPTGGLFGSGDEVMADRAREDANTRTNSVDIPER